MRHKARLFVVCWLISALVFGCSPRRPPAQFRIAVIPKGTTHAFWQAILAGAKKAAEEHGGVEIIWQGPGQEDNRQEQQDIVQRLTARNVSAIVLAPTDRDTLVSPVIDALDKGIPVVIIDSGLKETDKILKHEKYLGYVATDNEEGGRKAAEYMAKLLEGRGKARVLMLPYQTGSQSTELREKGFREGMARHKNIELIVASEEAGATVSSAQNAAERLLRNHRDVDGIFTPNESSTVGMLNALDTHKLTGKVKFVGFDGSDTLIAALKEGKIDGLVLQDPFQMGYHAVQRAIQALQGTAPEDRVFHTRLRVATRDNLDDPETRAMYAPGE